MKITSFYQNKKVQKCFNFEGAFSIFCKAERPELLKQVAVCFIFSLI